MSNKKAAPPVAEFRPIEVTTPETPDTWRPIEVPVAAAAPAPADEPEKPAQGSEEH